MTGLVVLLLTLALAGAAGAVHRARNGRMRGSVPTAAGHDEAVPDLRRELAGLGLEPGERGTLLQFSSAFCAPCRVTRALLADAAHVVPGVRHLEVDVADGSDHTAALKLALVRRLDIRRTPTTLVLDAAGREIRRASGVPRREQVLAALADTVS
jgi:hypothetical protein